MSFLLAVISSALGAGLFVYLSGLSWRQLRAYPRGVKFVHPDRQDYLRDIAGLIRRNRMTFVFKGITGFDLFASDVIRSALEETRVDSWQRLLFILTDPGSQAFSAEANPYYTASRLRTFQDVTVDFVEERLLTAAPRKETSCAGVFFLDEAKTLINLLILDNHAFVFFRGFSVKGGPTQQVIIRVDLRRCPDALRQLIEHTREYYASMCERAERSGTETAHWPKLRRRTPESPGRGQQ